MLTRIRYEEDSLNTHAKRVHCDRIVFATIKAATFEAKLSPSALGSHGLNEATRSD